jgi:hypothetical protein
MRNATQWRDHREHTSYQPKKCGCFVHERLIILPLSEMLATTAAFISETFKAKEIRKCQFKPEAERTHVMGLFNDLMSKIFSHPTATGRSASQTAAAAPTAGGAQQPQGSTTPAS